jgi:hypothetical protein
VHEYIKLLQERFIIQPGVANNVSMNSRGGRQ